MTMTTYRGSGSSSVVAAAGACRLPMPEEAIGSGLTPGKWRVLSEAIWPAAKTQAAIMLAVDYCKARNLDPLKRPVHIVPMYSTVLKKMVETVWPGINEIQVTAARTGHWAGMDAPKWGPDITQTWEGKPYEDESGDRRPGQPVTVTFPEWCEVTVYRMVDGERCAFTEPVYWLEAYARVSRWSDAPNDMWRRRARGQLHKCAKAAVLRAAFPECASDYAAEEMEGKELDAVGPVIEGQHGPVHEENDQVRAPSGEPDHAPPKAEAIEPEPKPEPAKRSTIPVVYHGEVVEEHASIGAWWGALKRNWIASRTGTSNVDNLSVLRRLIAKLPEEDRGHAQKMLADMEEDAEAEPELPMGGDPAAAREMGRNMRAG